MIEAYLDESGIHDGAKVCVIAGYFGSPSRMRKLELEWKRVLASNSFPMEDFHAKDLVKNRDSYPLLKKLARVISDQKKVYPITWAVLVDDFNSFSLAQRRFFTGAILDPETGKLFGSGCPTKPYFAPFQNIVKTITNATPVGGKAHFVFGLNSKFSSYALDLFRRFSADAAVEKPYSDWKSKERLGNPLFPLAAKTAQLQAADLLVHLTYCAMHKWVMAGAPNQNDPRISKLLDLCHANSRGKGDHVFQDKKLLRLAVDQAKKFAPKWQDE